MSQSQRRITLVIILFSLLVFQSCSRKQSALDRVRRSGELRIGTDATYAPFESVEEGEYVGFDIDLGHALARELGVRPVFINTNFDGSFLALQNGSFDIVMSSVSITPKRKSSLLFSDPYYDAGQMIAVRNNTQGINNPDDLRGRRVGVQLGTTAQDYFENQQGVEIYKYDAIDLAMLALRNGSIDAVVADAPTLHYKIRQSYRDLKIVGQQFTDEKFGIALAQGSEDLQQSINDALKRIKASGEYDQIHKRWFGEAALSATDQHTTQVKSIAFDLNILRQTLPTFLTGLLITARLALLSLLFGLPIGLLLALARLQPLRLFSIPAAIYVEVMRGTPLLVQIIFIHFGLPPVTHITLPAFVSAVIALTLNSAAYICEIIRAGILSIDAGQMEAARSLGMSYWEAMRRIILPQTFRRVVPPLTNEAIALLKDSSLASVLALAELTQVGRQLANSYAAPLTIWPIVAIFYLLLTFPLTRVSQYLEIHWQPIKQ